MDGEEEIVDVSLMSDEQSIQKMRDLDAEVKSLISRNSAAAALKAVTAALPSPTKSEEAKKIGAEAFLSAILAIPSSSVEAFLNDSTPEERQTIMTYTYRCMQIADKKGCEVLLVWHGKIVLKDGHGIINRVIFDKRV